MLFFATSMVFFATLMVSPGFRCTGACCEVSPDDLVVENYIAVFVSSRPIEWYCFWPRGSAFT